MKERSFTLLIYLGILCCLHTEWSFAHLKKYDNLLVRNCLRAGMLKVCKNVTICGNLTVNGVINNQNPDTTLNSFDVDNGANVVPLANVVQVSGLSGAGFVPSGIETHNGGGTGNDLFIENRRWISQYVVDTSATVGERGTFTTIQAAIDAIAASGSPGNIYLRPGVYTENLTFRNGVNITGAGIDGRLPISSIIGNHTFSENGVCGSQYIEFHSPTGDTFTINPASGNNSLFVLKFCQVQNAAGIVTVLNPAVGAFAIFGIENCILSAGLSAVSATNASVASLNDSSANNNIPGQPLFIMDGNAIAQITLSILNSTGDIYSILSPTATVQNTYNNSSAAGALVRFAAPGTVNSYHGIVSASDPSGNYIIGAGTLNYADTALLGSAINIDPATTQNVAVWRPFATAGTSVTAIKGTSAFDDTQFTVTNGFVQLLTPPSFAVTYTDVTTSPYVVTATDYYLSVDTSAIAITIQLPDAPTANRTFVIKDRTGNAAVNNITVTTVGGVVLIDGLASQTMATNFQTIQLIFNGTSYEIY